MSDEEQLTALMKRAERAEKRCDLLTTKLARQYDIIHTLRMELSEVRHALRRFVPGYRIPKTEVPS